MGSISVQNLSKAYKQYSSRFRRLLEGVAPGHAVRHQHAIVLQVLDMSKKKLVGCSWMEPEASTVNYQL
jgi:lipopolysaccharide transport system ATP-binding protein